MFCSVFVYFILRLIIFFTTSSIYFNMLFGIWFINIGLSFCLSPFLFYLCRHFVYFRFVSFFFHYYYYHRIWQRRRHYQFLNVATAPPRPMMCSSAALVRTVSDAPTLTSKNICIGSLTSYMWQLLFYFALIKLSNDIIILNLLFLYNFNIFFVVSTGSIPEVERRALVSSKKRLSTNV